MVRDMLANSGYLKVRELFPQGSGICNQTVDTSRFRDMLPNSDNPRFRNMLPNSEYFKAQGYITKQWILQVSGICYQTMDTSRFRYIVSNSGYLMIQ